MGTARETDGRHLVRQINNYWFNDGIHEGEASMNSSRLMTLPQAPA